MKHTNNNSFPDPNHLERPSTIHLKPPVRAACQGGPVIRGLHAEKVACYNCEAIVCLEVAGRQWCPECNARLRPAPAWVEAAGWPTKPVPAQQRNRRTRRARIPIKAVRFDSPDGRGMAGTIEILAKRERLSRNDLMLDLLRRGIQHRLDSPQAPQGEGL